MGVKHYGLTEKGGRLFEVMDAVTCICNDEKDASSLDAEVTVPEILAHMNRTASITSETEVEDVLRELEEGGLVYYEDKEPQ